MKLMEIVLWVVVIACSVGGLAIKNVTLYVGCLAAGLIWLIALIVHAT